MRYFRVVFILLCILGLAGCTSAAVPKWQELRNIEQTAEGFVTTGPIPWLLSEPFSPIVPQEKCYLLIEMTASLPMKVQFRWLAPGDDYSLDRLITFDVPAGDKPVMKLLDMNSNGVFKGLQTFRFDPINESSLNFKIHKLQFVTLSQVPAQFLPELIKFRCYTSKLHYQPAERIEYCVSLTAKNYPQRESSKILQVDIVNDKGLKAASKTLHYGLPMAYNIKELYGSFALPAALKPGKYTLKAASVDQLTKMTLSAEHQFGVQGPNDPFVCETPFKFLKDFTIIQDQDGLFHLFSITGEFFAGHDWMPAGNERTFSHSTSRDLRNWTYHPPVISISDKSYPDGNGKFKDRNVWSPHVIFHDGTYYMFYTSVNRHVSQSMSLATSKDLFEWKDYENNPVLAPEDAGIFNWHRNQWADCRDPMVFKDNGKFYVYLTAAAADGDPKGTVLVAESDDLLHWSNPQIAVRSTPSMESPQVWKMGDTYYMTTSALGAGLWTSKSPTAGWQRCTIERPPIQKLESYVPTSPSYAEEVIRLKDGSYLIAGLTWRHWGNSIYFFRMETDDSGKLIGYKSPFKLP